METLVAAYLRQPFGFHHVKQLGRPSGWIIFVGLFEKVAFLLVLVLLIMLEAWWPLALTIIAESLLFTVLLVVFSKGHRLEYAVKGVSATPFRYAMMAFEVIVFTRFVFDLWTTRRSWRK